MSDAAPTSEMLSAIGQLAAQVGKLLGLVNTLTGKVDTLIIDAEALKTGQKRLELRMDAVEAGLAQTKDDLSKVRTDVMARLDRFQDSLGQTRDDLSKVRTDVMDRLDRFQASLDNVRDSTAVTLMMDQRVNKKLVETSRDRDDLFEQMMAMERQMMVMSLRIDSIEDRRH